MGGLSGFAGRAWGFLHHHFLGLLVGAYLLAAAWPGPGAALRHAALPDIGAGVVVTLPVLLLGFLLFTAVPLLVVAGLAWVLVLWHDPDEARCLVVGLGVVAAMPVAGSSAAWSQRAGGSPALSLGLVVATTLLSPVTTPLALAAVGPLAGDAPAAGLGGAGTVGFLLTGVVAPSLAGMAARFWAGPEAAGRVSARLKLAGTVVLLVLCYANATASLPAVAAAPDWDYLGLVVGAAIVLCGSGFAAGWGVARLVRAGGPQRRSLVFGLGMTNNGTGLVLAGTALAGIPAAVLPVLAYNLVQHLVAGAVSRSFGPGGR